MKAASQQWIRRAQLLGIVSLAFIIVILVLDAETLSRFGLNRLQEPWQRNIAISRGVFALLTIASFLFFWHRKIWVKECLAFAAVSATVNLVGDLPFILQTGGDETAPAWVAMIVMRGMISLLALSLYLDFANAPINLSLRQSLFSLSLKVDRK